MDDEQVMQPLLDALMTGDEALRLPAVNALAGRGGPIVAIVRGLAGALTDRHRSIRLATVRVLAGLERHALVVEALVRASDDEDPTVQLAAVDALADRSDTQVAQALVPILEQYAATDEATPRSRSAAELQRMTIELAIDSRENSRERVRHTLTVHDELAYAAVQALEGLPHPVVHTPLVRELVRDCRERLLMRVLEREIGARLRSSSPESRGDHAALGESSSSIRGYRRR
jgi:HEAT repeat protein